MKTLNDFKIEIKNQWLNYWQENQNWIIQYSDKNKNWIYFNKESSPSFRMPNRLLILGIVSALNLEFTKLYLSILVDLNQDLSELIRSLGLNFDPNIEFKKFLKNSEKNITNYQLKTNIYDDINNQNLLNKNNIKWILKDKWLDYWEINKNWIIKYCDSTKWSSWFSLNEGRRPPSEMIIGIISVLELNLGKNLSTLIFLNGKSDALINALGLNFDPDIELENRNKEREKAQQEANLLPPPLPPSPLDDFRQKIKKFNNTS